MEIKGIDIQDMKVLLEMLDLMDSDCYLNLLLPSLPREDVTHHTDIRIVSLDELKDEIHLSNRVGWMIESGIGEEWASMDKLYEATASLKSLLDETIPACARIRLVQWREAEVQRVAKENKISEDGLSRKSVITTTWNKVDNSPRMDDVVAAVDKINAATRARSPCLSNQQANTRFPHVDYVGSDECSEADIERVIRRINNNL